MNIGLGLQHEIGNLDQDHRLRLNTANAQSFNVQATPHDRNTVLVQTAIGINLTDTIEASLSYHGNFSQDIEDQAVSARLNWKF